MTRPPCCRAAAALAMSAALSTAAGYTAGPAAVLLLGLAELVDELVGVAADRLVEDDLLVVVGGVAQHVALAFEDKARIGHLLLDDRRVDAVQGVGVAQARSGLGHVVDDQEDAAGLQRLVDRPVEDHRVDLAHELVRIVVIILDREHQVYRLRRREGRPGLQDHRGVGIAGLGELSVLHRVGLGFLGVLVRPDHVDVALGADGLREDLREVARARDQVDDLVAGLHARKGDDFARVAARVGVTVGVAALVGDRGGDGRRDRRGGCGHGDDGGGAGGQKQGFHGLIPVKVKLRAKAPAGSPPCQWAPPTAYRLPRVAVSWTCTATLAGTASVAVNSPWPTPKSVRSRLVSPTARALSPVMVSLNGRSTGLLTPRRFSEPWAT